MKNIPFFIVALCALVLGTSLLPAVSPAQQPAFRLPIAVVDSEFNITTFAYIKTKIDTVWIGVNPNATYCLDPVITGFTDHWSLFFNFAPDSQIVREYELPPPLPQPASDFRLTNSFSGGCTGFSSLGNGVRFNIHNYASPTQRDTFKLLIQQDNSVNNHINVRWPSSAVLAQYCDSLFVRSPASGSRINANMLQTTNVTVDTSAILSFVLIEMANPKVPPPPPLNITAASPPDGATGQPLSLAVSWNPGQTPKYYLYQISSDSTFRTVLRQDTTSSTTSATLSNLQLYTWYYWRVVVFNDYGVSFFQNPPFKFQTLGTPGVPTLLAPANGSSGVPISPTLSWTKPFSPTSLTYRLQISTDNGFATLVKDTVVADSSLQVGPLVNCTNYYWHVNAINSFGSSSYSTTRSFKSVLTTPAVPVLTSPGDTASQVPLTVVLSWTGDLCTELFTVQLARDSGFNSLVVSRDLAQTSTTVGPLGPDSVYFWHVRARNSFPDSSAFSAPRSFRTTGIVVPNSPVLRFPPNGAGDQPSCLTLRWDSAVQAITYRLQVAVDTAFTALKLNDSTLTGVTRQVCGLLNSTTYYWRVNARNTAGTSSYSTRWTFTTLYPPDAAILINPAPGATGVSVTPQFDWSLPARADVYQLQIAQDTLFNRRVFDDSTLLVASWRPPGVVLDGLTKYFWRVRAKNSAGWGGWTAASFTTTRTGVSSWAIPLTVAESGPQRDIVYFGVNPDATVGIDPGLGEFELPPVQSGFFDARFLSPYIGEGLRFDLLPFKTYSQVDTFQVQFQPGLGTYPFTFSWPMTIIKSICDSMVIADALVNPTVHGRMDLDSTISVNNSFTHSMMIVIYGAFPMPLDVKVPPRELPKGFVLYQNYPNPFNPSTSVRFSTDRAARVRIVVYDILGREVITLANSAFFPGQYAFQWDGRDQHGMVMPSGIYYARMVADGMDGGTDRSASQVIKMLMIK